jgi:predicted LPLAT superfamily acyltransferase
MPKWTGKTRGGLAGYSTFVLIIKYFGLGSAYFVLGFVVIYFVITAPQARKSSYRFFRKRLNYPPGKSVLYVLKNFYRFGQTLIDKVAFLAGFHENFTFDFVGDDYLKQMAAGKGGVLIGIHAGNWEIAGFMLKGITDKIRIVIFDDEHPEIRKLLRELYEGKELDKFIFISRESYSHLHAIAEAIHNHSMIVLHGDRFLPGTKTFKIPFFNEEALFPAGPFLLSLKYDVPYSFVYSFKTSGKHYKFYATPPKKYKNPTTLEERDLILKKILREYTSNLEQFLIKYPDQWFNFYDFWAMDDTDTENLPT